MTALLSSSAATTLVDPDERATDHPIDPTVAERAFEAAERVGDPAA